MADLRALFQRAAKQIITAFGTVPEDCSFHKVLFDANGQPTGSVTTITGMKAVRQDFSTEKIDGSTILKQDRQYIIAASDFGGVEPKEDDTLDFGGDEIWTIHIVQTDPAGATHILHVRK